MTKTCLGCGAVTYHITGTSLCADCQPLTEEEQLMGLNRQERLLVFRAAALHRDQYEYLVARRRNPGLLDQPTTADAYVSARVIGWRNQARILDRAAGVARLRGWFEGNIYESGRTSQRDAA